MKEAKAKLAQEWFALWPVGTRAIVRGRPRHHVTVVAHEIGWSGWPILRLEEEITGATFYCLYHSRASLCKKQ